MNNRSGIRNANIPTNTVDGYNQVITRVRDGYSPRNSLFKRNISITNGLIASVAMQKLGSAQDGYVLTWNAADGYYSAEPLPNQILPNTSFSCAYFTNTYFTQNSTWTCPQGVTNVLVIAAGGGQAGTNATSTASGVGGSGAIQTTSNIQVIPGTTYNIVIGYGGNNLSTNGLPTLITDGYSIIFSTIGASIIPFIGSIGGTINGLNGGQGSSNILNMYSGGVGGLGLTNATNTNLFGGNGGGAGPAGNGGAGGNAASKANGQNGSDALPNTGAGGGGGGMSDTGTGGLGGQGGSGYIILIY